MIIVSGLRAGLVIGLIVTPSKIQHDGSRWNRKFGSGGSSMRRRIGRLPHQSDVLVDVGLGDPADQEVGDRRRLRRLAPTPAPAARR